MWSKLKSFFNALWARVRSAGNWLIGGLIAAVLVVGAIVGLNQSSDKKSDSGGQPEVAQVYEPSIGTPLPPDNPGQSGNDGQVAGDNTGVSATVNPAAPSTTFVSPSAGVDPTQPIKYENSSLGFKTVLPPGTIVDEKTGTVSFYDPKGTLLYLVEVAASTDSLDAISAQLEASQDVDNVSRTTFIGLNALQFSTRSATGYVALKNNKVYYFIGAQDKLQNITI